MRRIRQMIFVAALAAQASGREVTVMMISQQGGYIVADRL